MEPSWQTALTWTYYSVLWKVVALEAGLMGDGGESLSFVCLSCSDF